MSEKKIIPSNAVFSTALVIMDTPDNNNNFYTLTPFDNNFINNFPPMIIFVLYLYGHIKVFLTSSRPVPYT